MKAVSGAVRISLAALAAALACTGASAQTVDTDAGAARPARADTQSSPSDPAATGVGVSSSQASDDIVVTARRREESLQRVPLAVSAFSGTELRSKGVVSLQDIGRFTPGLNATPHPTAASVVQFNLRGQSSGDVITTVDPAVGVYQDGIYISRVRGLNAGFFDLDRVEVLKGPQGTLYGRNTTGGAISLYTRGADMNGVHGFIEGQAGKYNLLELSGAVNLPLIDDKLAVRLAFQGTRREGFGKSAITQQDIGQDRNQLVARGSLLFKPTETFSLEGKAQYYRSRENNALYILRYVLPTGNGVTEATIERTGLRPGQAGYDAARAATLIYLQGLAAAGATDFNTNYIDNVQRDDNDVTSLSLTGTWEISDAMTLKSITGYRRFKVEGVSDADATPFDVFIVGIGDNGGDPVVSGKPGSLSGNFSFPYQTQQTNRFFSQEINASGVLFGERLNWLVGGFYSNESGRDVQQAALTPALTNFFFVNDGYRVTTKNWAIFTQNDFKITDQLSVTFGVRYTEDRKGLVSRLGNFFPATGLFQCGTGVIDPVTRAALLTTNAADCQTSNMDNFTGVSYLGSINFQLTPNVLLYARTARGFRSGSFQLRAPTLAPAGPETAKDYELGVKADLFDRVLRINAAAFQTKYSGKQESTIIRTPAGANATVITNAADATLKGFEAEVRLRPMAGLTLGGTVSYLYGKYDRYPGALPIQSGAAIDASGERFSTPPWSYSLSGRYDAPLDIGRLGVQVDWAWQSGANPSARLINPNLPIALVDSTVASVSGGSYTNGRASLGLMNARIDLNIESAGVTLAVFATNMLNHRYLLSAVDSSAVGGFATYNSGAPRMIGVSLRKRFGND